MVIHSFGCKLSGFILDFISGFERYACGYEVKGFCTVVFTILWGDVTWIHVQLVCLLTLCSAVTVSFALKISLD